MHVGAGGAQLQSGETFPFCNFINIALLQIVEPVFDKDFGQCYIVRVNARQRNAGAGLLVSLNLRVSARFQTIANNNTYAVGSDQ